MLNHENVKAKFGIQPETSGLIEDTFHAQTLFITNDLKTRSQGRDCKGRSVMGAMLYADNVSIRSKAKIGKVQIEYTQADGIHLFSDLVPTFHLIFFLIGRRV